MVVVSVGLLCLMALFVFLRVVARVRHGGAGWDDGGFAWSPVYMARRLWTDNPIPLVFLYLSFAWNIAFLVAVIISKYHDSCQSKQEEFLTCPKYRYQKRARSSL